jgi:hypothetical protein
MPQSVIIYTNRERLHALQALAQESFRSTIVKPYTISFGQKTEQPDLVRVRITELEDDAYIPMIRDEAAKGGIDFASSSDNDVRKLTYKDILEEASPALTKAALQFMSPVILPIPQGGETLFPVASLVLTHYRQLWNSFSTETLSFDDEMIRTVTVEDFKISCQATACGTGSQGWLALDIKKGHTEDEVRAFNALLDFSFFCGTGMYTDFGLGQTKRMKISHS